MRRNVLLSLLPPLSLLGALALPSGAAGVSGWLWIASTALIMDGLLRPGSRLFGPGLHRAPLQPRVALTFDDGPEPRDTPAILDILEEAGAFATFFFVGNKARRHPDLVRRVVGRGHELGNHSDTHPWWFSLAGPARIQSEIQQAGRTLERLGGRDVLYFRPPMGHNNIFLGRALGAAGLEKVLWSCRPFDTLRRSPEKIRRSVLASAAPGGILLLHEGVAKRSGAPSRTVAALPGILHGLREKGLEPVPLGRLLGTS
jgi:peptidoglycan/xylan/chitin deacetylase (PgdA/CDA1 family)